MLALCTGILILTAVITAAVASKEAAPKEVLITTLQALAVMVIVIAGTLALLNGMVGVVL